MVCMVNSLRYMVWSKLVVQVIQERAILLERSLLSVCIYQRGKEKIPDVKKRNRFVFIPSFIF